MNQFLKELHRRNVLKAGVTYVIAAWAILQATDLIFPLLHISQSFVRIAFYVLLAGFPAWVTFAWFYEYTPEGFRKTEDVAADASISRRTGKKLNAYIIAGLTLAVFLLLADRFFNLSGGFEDGAEFKSIAVLPFDNMGSDEDAFFASGITEDILTQISKIADLRVLSSFTLRDYNAEGKSPREIGRELNVVHLLIGTVRRAGESLRIGCQLIETNSESATWAETFDRKMENVFVLQSEIAQKVANLLEAQLSSEEKNRIEKAPTGNLAAYNMYLKAKEHYYKYTPEDNETAITLFSSALDLDPKFGLALAGLTDSYIWAATRYSTRPYAFVDTALITAKQAIELAPEAGETWKALGMVQIQLGEWDKAIETYKFALEKNPNLAGAINNLALLYRETGRLDEAIQYFNKNKDIDPLSSATHFNLCASYVKLEMYDKAAFHIDKAIKLRSDEPLNYGLRGELFILMNNDLGAKEDLEKSIELRPDNAYMYELAGYRSRYLNDDSYSFRFFKRAYELKDYSLENNWYASIGLAYTYWNEGNKEAAIVLLDESLKARMSDVEGGAPAHDVIAAIYSIRGDKEKALHWVEEAIDAGFLEYRKLQLDPWLSTIHEDPRFIGMMGDLSEKVATIRKNVVERENR